MDLCRYVPYSLHTPGRVSRRLQTRVRLCRDSRKYPAVVPSLAVYGNYKHKMSAFLALRVGCNSFTGFLKHAGFAPRQPPSGWLHIALVRDPYERYLSSLWIAASSAQSPEAKPQGWESFLHYVEALNWEGDFYTWDDDPHFATQTRFYETMTDPSLFIPLEHSTEALAKLLPNAPKPMPHINETPNERKALAREIISWEPVLDHYVEDQALYYETVSGRAEADRSAGVGPQEPATTSEIGLK